MNIVHDLIILGFLLIILGLILKIYLLKKSAKEVKEGFTYIVNNDTNILIDISTRDKDFQELAESINLELRNLREVRQKFQLFP